MTNNINYANNTNNTNDIDIKIANIFKNYAKYLNLTGGQEILTTNETIGIFDPEGLNPNPLNSQPYTSSYKNLAKFWSKLPAYKNKSSIVQTIKSNDVILIKSGTGSGKTVLVPKFCLHANEYKGKIIITLPKKIITKKAAEFSAKTLDVELGEHVGYQFRGDNAKSSKTILLYSTDGSVISMIKSDPTLKSIDMVVIDEAHERKVNIDLLLYLIKNTIKLREQKKMKPLKLIIMSATINEDIFKSYYQDFKFDWMELAGTPNYPIKSIYLESSLDIKSKSSEYLEKGKEIIAQIIKKINSNEPEYILGDIIFFVCGVSECDEVAEELGEKYPECFTMGLYSGFDSELEPYISNPLKYKELNPNYKLRLFVSTNVAESSITIDGIVYVIDSGLELNVKFNPASNTNVMEKNYITQAQMTQRKGRAGRTQPGMCFHLYTPQIQESTNKFPSPEIRCIDLKNTCLSMMKICSQIHCHDNIQTQMQTQTQTQMQTQTQTNTNIDCDISQTIKMFYNFIEPPGEKFITNGFEFALKNELIDSQSNKLTKLGKLIIETRLDLMDGIALLYAHNISTTVFKAVFKIITICSFLKSSPLDLFNEDVETQIKSNIINKLVKISNDSEHVLLYNLYLEISKKKDSGIFEIELYDTIYKTYHSQITRLESMYEKFNIKIDGIVKKDLNTNIINSFGYGYKHNRAKMSKHTPKYEYNGIPVDMSKCLVKINPNVKFIIFYSNLYWSGRLNVMICSPYLLK